MPLENQDLINFGLGIYAQLEQDRNRNGPTLAPSNRAHSFDPALSLYNPESKWMRKIQNEVAKAMTGTGRVQGILMGHSYLAGSNAVPGTTDVGTMLRKHLRGRLGDRVVPTPISAFRNGEIRDSHYSGVSAGWGLSNGAARTPFGTSTVANDELTFTSTEPGTIVDIYTFENSPAFTYQINGGAVTNVPTGNGQAAVRVVSIAGLSDQNHVVKIVAPTAGAYFVGIGVRTAAPGLEVFNFGYGGSFSADWTSITATAFRGLSTQVASARTFVVLEIDTNDTRSGITTAAWKANMETIIASHIGLGHGVLLVMSVDAQFDASASAKWKDYYAAGYGLADKYDIPLFDQTHALSGWTSVVTDGLQGDTLHLNPTGQSRVASKLADILMS